MGRARTSAVFAAAITDDRQDAVAVDLLLHEEDGETLLVRSAGISLRQP